MKVAAGSKKTTTKAGFRQCQILIRSGSSLVCWNILVFGFIFSDLGCAQGPKERAHSVALTESQTESEVKIPSPVPGPNQNPNPEKPGQSPIPDLEKSILGTWKYIGFDYEGHRYSPADPRLNLTFTFTPDGIDRLFWETVGEPGLCERKASYKIVDHNLIQENIWVNPNNKAECSHDPDMQMGKISTTKFEISESEIHFILELNGKDLIYILKNLP